MFFANSHKIVVVRCQT